MKKASLFSSAFLATLAAIGIATPALAQDGMFKDVPNDHWSYQALERLGADKIFIGDPDGTFKGKRTLTRYEMAMVVDRMLRLLDERYVKAPLPDFPKPGNNGVTAGQVQDMLNGYAKKSDLDGKADKSALNGLAKQADIDMLRRMAAEFQTELTSMGTDVDKVKKTLDNHEKRIGAIEDALKKRVQVSGAFNAYVRSTFTNDGTSFRDKDGYLVSRGGAASDARVMHDLDVNLKANPTENTNVDIAINFGNYLPYLGTTTNFTGNRSNRYNSGFDRNDGGPVSLDQAQTLWKAVFSYSKRLPILGETGVQVGRVPFKLTPYTFHGFDVDSYFNNSKTDSGAIPVDGLVSNFNFGRLAVTAFAAKNDPIQFVSNSGYNGYSYYGGEGGIAIGGMDAWGGGLVRGNVLRAPGSNRGAGMLSQMAGAHLSTTFGSVGVGGTFISSGVAGGDGFDQTNVYGGSLSLRVLGANVNGEYSKSDLRGVTDVNSISKRRNVVTEDNDAYDISVQFGKGSWNLNTGYRYVAPYFGAPGNWARLGTLQNPTDIQGVYGTLDLSLGSKLGLAVSGQSYEGTTAGDSGSNKIGLGSDDKIVNVGAKFNYKISPVQSFGVGYELTTFDRANRASTAGKPEESFLTFVYNKMLSASSAFSLGYQIADFKAKGDSIFDQNDKQQGGIFTSTFSVRF